MNFHFLFPASALNPRMIDEAFQDEAITLKQAGFGTSVIDDQGFIRPKPEPGATCVYRGWMLTPEEYGTLHRRVVSYGVEMLISPEQYLVAHWLPNWYPLLKQWTPETVIVPFDNNEDVDLVGTCRNIGWEKFILKDYVKSLKTAGGSVATSPEQVPEIVDNMRKYRGTIEGGVCIRRWEEFLKRSEIRYFIINKRFYGMENLFDLRAMSILDRIKDIVPSPFYSVDIVQRDDGEFRIVEIEDGQVSDLVGWTPERFAAVWKEVANTQRVQNAEAE